MTKPFSLAEVVARTQAILRRTAGEPPGRVFRYADLVLDERRLSLPSRLVLALLVVAAAGLVAVDVATYTSLRSFLFDQADQTLESEHHFADRGGRGTGRPPPGLYVEVRSLTGALLYSQSAASA